MMKKRNLLTCANLEQYVYLHENRDWPKGRRRMSLSSGGSRKVCCEGVEDEGCCPEGLKVAAGAKGAEGRVTSLKF